MIIWTSKNTCSKATKHFWSVSRVKWPIGVTNHSLAGDPKLALTIKELSSATISGKPTNKSTRMWRTWPAA